jgi:hypothetical protein
LAFRIKLTAPAFPGNFHRSLGSMICVMICVMIFSWKGQDSRLGYRNPQISAALGRAKNSRPDFGIYVNDNFHALNAAGVLTREGLIWLARNSFEGSFLSHAQKDEHLAAIDMIAREF